MDSSDEYVMGEEDDWSGSDFGDHDDAMEELGEASPTSVEEGGGGGAAKEEMEYPFEVLPASKILQLMNDYIREGTSVLELPPTTMRLLLNYFKWDKDKLLEAYWERDQEELFREAGAALVIRDDNNQEGMESGGGGGGGGGVEECEICCEENPKSMTFGMDCGHRFCNNCWTSYLTTKIMEDGQAVTISCAAHKCPVYVDDAAIMKLVTDVKVQLKYQQLITNGFVQSNRRMRWCPATDCTNVIQVQWTGCRPVRCACGHHFCFGCGHDSHTPIDCALLKKWMQKCVDDSGNYQWIAVNTKACPKCNADIEKNGGCNHMRCTNINCNADFCWMCLTVFGPNYSCRCRDNGGFAGASAPDQNDKESIRLSLLRFGFYHDRYMNQMQSLKLEGNLYASVEEKIKELQLFNMTWVELQFLKKAVDILIECRQMLMYTYVFAFYLEPDHNQSALFEENQRDLENATETLSEYLEREIDSAEDLADIKIKVQDKISYCEGRSKALVEHVKDGYEKEWWEFLE